ncbi:MAG: M23 family metallopeptidase [Patescibacteria group bacterium]
MVQDTPARKRIAFLIITLALISFAGSTKAFAATKAAAKAASPKTATAAKKAAPAKTAKAAPKAKTSSTSVKGEKVVANKIAVVGDNTISTYTVKKGDTISSIAKKFDISINTIRWSNGISSKGSIKVGQKLTILPTSGVIYVVKTGDTLSGIAVKFSADQEDILNANSLENADSLKVGMKLAIPNTEPLDSEVASAVTHDDTTLTENISPIALPQVTAADVAPAATQSPVVTAPVVEEGPVPGTAMMVSNPVTKDTYQIIITKPTDAKTYTIPSEDIRGYYAQPVSGKLSQGIHDVNAVDISAPNGTQVHASAKGTVIVAKDDGKYNGGYGNYIVISHPNSSQTLYAHLSKVSVALGEVVSQGEPIGLSGSTGRVTGAHLHFEIRGASNPWGSDSKGTVYNI